jgi:penicillin V acylase-like amidase (Ntn superfamily)
VANTKHLVWKEKNARPTVDIPGNFYPDSRFLRVFLLRGGLPKPSSHREAMMQVREGEGV